MAVKVPPASSSSSSLFTPTLHKTQRPSSHHAIASRLTQFHSEVVQDESGGIQIPDLSPEDREVESQILARAEELADVVFKAAVVVKAHQNCLHDATIQRRLRGCDNIVCMGLGTLSGPLIDDNIPRLNRRLSQLLFGAILAKWIQEARANSPKEAPPLRSWHRIKLFFQDPAFTDIDVAILARFGIVAMRKGVEDLFSERTLWYAPTLLQKKTPAESITRRIKIFLTDFITSEYDGYSPNFKALQRYMRNDCQEHVFLPLRNVDRATLRMNQERDPASSALYNMGLWIRKDEDQKP
ncbi:MAG: hypothetical protein Q9159_000340 [Coniocarpon cinnabarinum]